MLRFEVYVDTNTELSRTTGFTTERKRDLNTLMKASVQV